MKKLLLITAVSLPAFALLLRPGIHTMHDFHVFRQHQFDLCAREKIFPCRWSPDSGKGYGEPVFNFYSQLPYWLGEIPKLLNIQIIDSIKISFIVSLVLSGISMFFLSREFWGDKGALVSALFYLYAPYRAVDVWVRGALPESLGFVFFPLILLVIYKARHFRQVYLPVLALLTAGLAITHNLSLFMFLPFMLIWAIIWRVSLMFVAEAGLLAILLSAFYILPVTFEKHLVSLAQTTVDYYQYASHFVSLNQLFLSRFWGYGGSTWGPNDTMSFSAGHLHWIMVAVVCVIILVKKLTTPHPPPSLGGGTEGGGIILISTCLGLIALFLTHGKSDLIWKIIPGMSFIQFPWRFLTLSTLFLSLAAGGISRITNSKLILSSSLALLLLTNSNWFKPDIWRPISDAEQFSGKLWDEQRSSALTDYWPVSAGYPPVEFAPTAPGLVYGEAVITPVYRGAHSQKFSILVSSYSHIVFPANYFPGWTCIINGVETPVQKNKSGLLSLRLNPGTYDVELVFKDTFVRSLGNTVSGLSLLTVASWLCFKKPLS